MPACTVLLFYGNHIIDVPCHMFIPTRVTLQSCHTGQGSSSKNSVHTTAVTAERPEVQGQAFKATSDCGTRQLMVNHLYYFLKPYVATRSLSIKRSPGQDVPRSSGESGGSSGG